MSRGLIDTDRYGRSVGVVGVGEGASLNEQLVAAGMAWLYPQYCKKEPLCGNLAALEKEARIKKVGLWTDTEQTAPWQWRKEKKKQDDRINDIQKDRQAERPAGH